MSTQTTLGDLKSRVLDLADMVGSQFVSDRLLTDYVNAEAAELHDILVAKFEDYILAPEYTFVTTPGTATYHLPDDFLKCIAVDSQITADNFVSLRPFTIGERNQYNRFTTNTSPGAEFLRYRIMGSDIRFTPTPNTATTIRLWYVPKYRRLENDGDPIAYQFVNGWDDYIVYGAAARAKSKESSLEDASQLLAMKAVKKQHIVEAAANRDAHRPHRVSLTWRRSDLMPGGRY